MIGTLMKTTQPEVLKDFSILQNKNLILDFDGVITKLSVNWSQLKSELLSYYQLKDQLSLADIYLYSRSISKQQDYISIVSKYETQSVKSAPTSSLFKFLVRNSIKFNVFSSNTKKTIMSFFQLQNFSQPIERVVSADDVFFLKPNPEGIKLLIQKNQNHYLFIGHSTHDEITARLANIEYLHYDFN